MGAEAHSATMPKCERKEQKKPPEVNVMDLERSIGHAIRACLVSGDHTFRAIFPPELQKKSQDQQRSFKIFSASQARKGPKRS